MSEIMMGVLRMADDLFWIDDPITRGQHNSIRKQAADTIEEHEARIAELEYYVGKFAFQAKNYPERHYQDDASPIAIRINVGDLRRAAALLKAAT